MNNDRITSGVLCLFLEVLFRHSCSDFLLKVLKRELSQPACSIMQFPAPMNPKAFVVVSRNTTKDFVSNSIAGNAT